MISFPVTLPFQNQEHELTGANNAQISHLGLGHWVNIRMCLQMRLWGAGRVAGGRKKLLDLRQRPPKPTRSSKGYVMLCILSCRDRDTIVAALNAHRCSQNQLQHLRYLTLTEIIVKLLQMFPTGSNGFYSKTVARSQLLGQILLGFFFNLTQVFTQLSPLL